MKFIAIVLSVILTLSFLVSCDQTDNVPEVTTTGVTTTGVTTTAATTAATTPPPDQEEARSKYNIVPHYLYYSGVKIPDAEKTYHKFDNESQKEKTLSVEYQGKEYVLSWLFAKEDSVLVSYNCERYKYEDDSLRINAELNTVTNELSWFSVLDNDYDVEKELEIAPKYTYEECLAIAKEYIAQNVPHGADFYKTSTDATEPQSEYSITFGRKIEGIKTSEEVRLTVTQYGDVRSYVLVDVGLLGDTLPFDVNELDEMTKAVKEKANAIFEEQCEMYFYYLDIELMPIPDGRTGLLYTFDTRYLLNGRDLSDHYNITYMIYFD